MDAIKPYWKSVLAVIAAVLSALLASVTGDGNISSTEWVNVAIAGVTAAAVFAAPNVPGARHTKTILAVLGAVLAVLSSAITSGISETELIQVLVAAVGAAGVYAKSNNASRTNAVV